MSDCLRTSENGCPHLQTGNLWGHSVLQVGTADFLFSPTLFGSLLRTPIPKAHPLVCHSEWPQSSNLLGSLPRREGTEVASMYESVSSNHRILSSCRLMFDRSYDKVKKQIGMDKFKPQGVCVKISTPMKG